MSKTNKYVIIAKHREPDSAPGNPKACFVAGQYFCSLDDAIKYLYPVSARSTAARRVKRLPDFYFINEKQNKVK